MKRNLVSFRIVKDVQPIHNADMIECITIDGWTVVSKKGEFVVGDTCVFFEIDSFLPANDERFEFLKKSGVKIAPDGIERIRLKTIKLRKQLSQGLALPIEQFDELGGMPFDVDLSEKLNVIKYERPEPIQSNCARTRPDFIPKTDEERIQNMWHKLKESNTLYVPTLKLDGSSCTIAFIGQDMQHEWCILHEDVNEDEQKKALEVYHESSGEKLGEIIVCSRNMQLKYDENSHFWKAVINSNLINDISKIADDLKYSILIQGEVCGPGIQGNKDNFPNYEFFAFNLYNITTQCYYNYVTSLHMFNEYEIQSVPMIENAFKPFNRFDSLVEMLDYADGKSINSACREGVVFKPLVDTDAESFKVISNRFLLKGGDE